DRYTHTREYLEGQVAILMGGRVAEETFLNHITTGASNDIERATELARKMVCEFGMSELGPLTFGRKEEQVFLGRDITTHQNYSEDTAIKIDQEVKRIITEQYNRAKQIIVENREALIRLAEALLEHESLDAIQIRRLVAGLPLDEMGSTTTSSSHKDDKPQAGEKISVLRPIIPPMPGDATA
ncbi:MAG: cell division protein FtsH, partial [Blastocatellia bacterium]|nr:cell division protein FtsH [Blastocatellia bacterium]